MHSMLQRENTNREPGPEKTVVHRALGLFGELIESRVPASRHEQRKKLVLVTTPDEAPDCSRIFQRDESDACVRLVDLTVFISNHDDSVSRIRRREVLFNKLTADEVVRVGNNPDIANDFLAGSVVCWGRHKLVESVVRGLGSVPGQLHSPGCRWLSRRLEIMADDCQSIQRDRLEYSRVWKESRPSTTLRKLRVSLRGRKRCTRYRPEPCEKRYFSAR